MHERKIGEPCPTCETPLQRRLSTFRNFVGDIAFCACCGSSFELAQADDLALALPGQPDFAPV
jgi:uncharacterized protein (DUF983 family)